MKRTTILAAAITAALGVATMSLPAFAAGLSSETPMGELIDNKEAKAVLDKHLPGMSENPQMEQARPMSLKALQQFAPNITDDVLKAVDADLAKIK
jgi:hypothetical protein